MNTTAWSLTTTFLLVACGSAPDPVDPAVTDASGAESDPSVEAEALRRKNAHDEAQRQRQRIERVLLDLDLQIDNWVNFQNAGTMRAEANGQKVRQFIGQEVDKLFDRVVRAASDPTSPRNRAIAAAALGFTENTDHKKEALEPILSALADHNDEVVQGAILGLAVLHDPRTPPTALVPFVADESRKPEERAGAAWALYQIQTGLAPERRAPIEVFWTELLAGPIDEEPGAVLVSAIRGIGVTRDARHLETIARYASHPTPRVRMATAVALGRMGDPGGVDALLTLIGPAESNTNVRLAARKALQALAGGVDRGYDVDQWARVFERGA